jgi:hypothetical protein
MSIVDTLPEEQTFDEAAYSEHLDSLSMEELGDVITSCINGLSDDELATDENPAILPALESLMAVVNDIQSAGVIARSDAQALMNMTSSLESFENIFANMPLTSYTELPSKVNYGASMESVVSRVIASIIEAIKRAIARIREMVAKLGDMFNKQAVVDAKVETALVAKTESKTIEQIAVKLKAAPTQEIKPVEGVSKMFDMVVRTDLMNTMIHTFEPTFKAINANRPLDETVRLLDGQVKELLGTLSINTKQSPYAGTAHDEPIDAPFYGLSALIDGIRKLDEKKDIVYSIEEMPEILNLIEKRGAQIKSRPSKKVAVEFRNATNTLKKINHDLMAEIRTATNDQEKALDLQIRSTTYLRLAQCLRLITNLRNHMTHQQWALMTLLDRLERAIKESSKTA